ncbi:hypothetical protein EF902_40450 [Streptomyces sp. WAC05858]|nr:hypothetical protein EF902_40450 [Streptomyces sp. WAC05858]
MRRRTPDGLTAFRAVPSLRHGPGRRGGPGQPGPIPGAPRSDASCPLHEAAALITDNTGQRLT